MQIPVLITIPNDVSNPQAHARMITEYFSDIMEGIPFLIVTSESVTEWDIIVPRFVGWRKYRKLRKQAIQNLKKIAQVK